MLLCLSARQMPGRQKEGCGEGSTQGVPEAGGYFCVAWHPHIRALDRRMSAAGGAARAGADDLFIIGPPDVVFQAMEQFWQEVAETCLLQVERSKTQVFTLVVWRTPS